MNRLLSWIVVLAVAPVALAQEPAKEKAEPAKPEVKKEEPNVPPAQPVNPKLHPRVKFETSLGDIVLELDGEKAPLSTDNFVTYVEAGYYNGTIFHRVIPDFMIQGGGYVPDGKEKKEGLRPPIKNEWQNGLKNVRGSISMARTNDPDSATSQFFINVADNTAGQKHDLDMARPSMKGTAAYAVFGKVVEGMDVVDKIVAVETRVSPEMQKMFDQAKSSGRPMQGEPEKSQPVNPPVVKSATLIGPFDHEAAKKQTAVNEAAVAAAQAKETEDVLKKIEAETGKKVEKTASGLMYVVLKDGDGPSPKPTDKVEVHYTGWLTNGTKFDSSVDRGAPFSFSLTGGVIKGWLEGVALMKVGEKRKLIIPYDLAYGEAGRAPTIPPKATLVFDIELLGIK